MEGPARINAIARGDSEGVVHPLRESRCEAKVRIEDLRETAHESRESSVGVLFSPTFLSPLSPVSGEFPFSLGRYLLDSEFVPTAATREILIVFLPVLLPAGGRKESRVSFQDRRTSNSGRLVSPTLRFHKIEPFLFNRS